MKNYRTELSQRVRYAIIAGMAGAFLIPQVGFAAPAGEHDYTAGVNVDRATANTTKITATATNNVINWRDYSVNQGENVQYDGGNKTNNYLNIVTGANTSNINGRIEGGNHVYIVNPNGVIFGKNAQVDVGHLNVSTQDGVSSAAKTAFETGGTSPLDNTAALKADVVNMGKITATSVEVHGAHIRFLNAADVKTSGGTLSSVDMYTAPAASSATDPDGGYAHIGYRTAAAPTNYTVHTASVSPEYYKLVKDKTELDAINSSTATLAGKYMLEQDIDLGGAAHTPIGGNSAPGAFTGKFDGNFFRVQNFNVSNVDSAGFFGEVSNGRIENFGVAQANIVGKRDNSHQYAGGIVGHTAGTSILKNVYVTDTTKVEGRTGRYGGIVGSTGSTSSSSTDHTVIDGAYSRAVIGRDAPGNTGDFAGGGIVGHSGNTTDISNSYSVATNDDTDKTAAYFLYIITPNTTTTVKNSYGVVGTEFSSNDNALSSNGKAVDTYKINGNKAEKIGATGDHTANASSTYTNWDINNDGAPGAKWRIYEGRTLPLLTAFMNGRVDSAGSVGANYSYRKFNQTDGFAVAGDANKDPISNNHADITGLTYDSKIVKIVDGSGNAGNTSNVTYDKTLTDDQKNTVKMYTDTGTHLSKTDNIRNAGTKAILWSDQDGPNLRNVNVTIGKRSVTVANSNITVTRRYNGKIAVTNEYNAAIRNGGITAGGITPEDIADGSVTITTSTDFKAEMDDKNVGQDKAVTLYGSLTFAGTDQSNYAITQSDFNFGSAGRRVDKVATITKAPLILKVTKDSTTKVYDGTDTVTEAAMSADPNIKLNETLRRTGETDAADIKSDDTNNKDDVSINYANIGSPTYIKSDGSAEVHAGTHKIRYKNVELQGNDKDNYELYYQMPDTTQKKVASNQIDLKGEITRRRITTNDFKVYEKGTNAPVEATKIYDGNNEYAPTNVYLSTDENGATGIVRRDKGYITFAMKDGKGHFIDNDTTKNKTKNVKEATRVAFTVTGVADSTKDTDGQPLYRLSDYYVLDANGVTKNDLNVGFVATGAGRITPKLLTANVVKNHIEKTYDGWADQTDGNRTKTVGDPLVTLSGWVAGDTARTNTSTATYASPNVAWDDTNKREQAQNVTYNVSFDRGSDADSDNYILDSSTSATDKYTLTLTQDGAGNNYTGTIKQREVALTMGPVDKIYDGTAANKKSDITSVAGKMGGTNDTAILNDDGITTAKLKTKHEQMMTAGTATSSFGRGTGAGFTENVNASNGTEHDVRYQNIDALFQAVVDAAKKNNYKVDDTVYGKGTINRRLIEKSGFQVRKSDGTIADATKVYDGTSTFALKNGETLVAKTAASGSDTGVVDKDKDNIYFTMTGENGHFTSDAAGANRTSHKSEANYAAYSVIAKTKNEGVSPLSNYEFGTSDTSKRNLENVDAVNPDAVTADGSITPAKIQAQMKEITKVYDGKEEHTDGNRNVQHGDSIVGLNLIADASGQPTNTSTAAYADKNVARDTDGTIIKKAVNYTAQLTGKYADDYEIVDAGNNVISSVNGTGDSKTVTATRNNVADMGTITPRTLNIKMGDVTKTYDGGSLNVKPSIVAEITDVPTTSAITSILNGDHITTSALQTAWDAKRTGGTASSSYGNRTGSIFHTNPNASNGTPHDVRYTNMDEAFKDAFGLTTAGNYTVDKTVYGQGTIDRKAIDPNNFNIVDANGHASHATKVYDGTSDYAVPSNWKLRPSTGLGTGLITNDADKIDFAIDPDKGAHFTKADNTTRTANAYEATRVAYNIKATAIDPDDAYLLKNYTLNGKNLESGEGTATGEGEITRRVLELKLDKTEDIDKVYDGETTLYNTSTNHWNALKDTDSAGNVKYVDGTTAAGKLVSGDGTSFHIESNYMSSAPVPAPDKNVRRDGTGQVISKDILYKITLNGDAANYSFNKGGTVTNAESGLELSATGKIKPKDISGAFKKITKVYDGTTSVDPTKVEFKTGTDGVLSGDTVNLATHTESFQSENVNGDGTTETIGGTAQKNWVNYSGLTLGGADAGNYTLASTARGLGEITPYQLNDNSITFTKRQAEKVYDGTQSVKHGDSTDLGVVKTNYITSAKVTVGTAPPVDILNDLELKEAQYDSKDVVGGTQPRVTYRLSYRDPSGKGNFSLKTGVTSFTTKGDGIITKKDVNVTVKSPLTKTYDATEKVTAGMVKNAAGETVSDLNKNLTLDGIVAGDGTTYTTTAEYGKKNASDIAKNAGTDKRINYTLTLTSNAGNYNLKYKGVDNSGQFHTEDNIITKRKVDVQFKNPPARTYNGSAENTAINPFVSSADAAVLRKDKQTLISSTDVQNLAGISSKYVQNDRVTEDPNAGKDKLVRFDNVRTAMNNALGSDASNYEFNETAYAKGTINKANIDTSKITFRTSGATKTYDGTDRVKYNGSSASDAVKNYITEATAHLGGGHTANLRGDLVIDEKETRYVSADAGTNIGVKYKFRLNNSNIEISGRNEFEMTDTGTIDRRVLNLDLTQKTGIDKIYDANAKLLDTNTRHYDKFTDDDALGNVTYAAGTTDDNKLVRTSNGASVNDGATMTIRANYVNAGVADKNVARDGSGNVAAKDIAYRVSIDAANGGQNYKLSDGVTTVDAETGLNLSARGTITPRELTLGFADVSKPYDTTAINATKNISNVAADERDGRGAATLAADGITAATFSSSTGGVTSLYGTGNTDATFHKDPNVVTDANGNVIERGKDVQYANVGSVLSGTNANNYTVADTAYGKGTIRKRTVSVNNFNFNISNATKEYDGTKDVEYVEGGKTYKDLPHLKKRFQTSTLDLGGGNTVPINLDDITLTGAKYNDERVAHATGINYDVTINAQNFEFNGGRDKRIEHTGDTITKRDLATKLPPHLVKEYDGEDSFTETNTVFANAMARANLTGVVDRDKNKIRLAVNGHYDSPDASTETREEAEARTPAQAGRNVHYDLTLSGDTDTLSNYKIGTVETLDSDGKMRGVGSGKADIYKKTLTVGVDNIDKLYDGTRTVVRPNGTDTLPHPEAGKFRLSGFVGSESFSFDQTAADKIDGLYSDPNVSRRNGAVVDKDISYSGIKTAFANYAGHDPTGYAKNYRVDSDTLSGKGKILPRPITANEITNGLKFDEATKVYDGTTKLKYNGQNTPDALKNYLKSATVNVDGTPINIRDDLTIRADEAYTHYDTQHVAGGAQPRVTYTLNYTGDNFDISGDLTKTANGVITKRKVTAFAPGQLTKVYDASEKVYDPRDTSIKTYRRGTRVTDGDSIVRMSTEDGDTGLLANDGVRNISTATFDDKNVGKRKKVTYNVAVDSTHAGDYEIVDTLGNTISELTTRNNEITPRPLDLTFDRVDKDYDGTSTNEDMPAARVTNSDTRRTLGRDRARIFNDELIMQDAAGNDLTLPSDYGYGSTDRSFTPDANANQAGEPDKSVQYRNMGDALRTILGDNAKNYEFKETGYGKGWINKAKVSERDFRLNFKDAVREYDGTSNVDHAIDNLQDDSRWKSNKMLKSDIASVTGTYMSPNGSTPDKNAADRKIVDYKVRLNERNFDFGSWDGVVSAEGGGVITKRKIIAETPRYLTKEYDGTKDVVGKARDAEGNLVKQNGDGLITFRHYNETVANKYDAADGLVAADTAGNTVRNATTALYADKNVAWKGGAWQNGHGDVADKEIKYTFDLSGTDAVNYEIVDADGKTAKNTTGKGKITPKDIRLKSDPQTRWINEGLPDSYTGTPTGKDYKTGVGDEALPGEIYYNSPNGKLRWGDYAINGYYRASDKARYQRPDGSWYQLADKDKTPDGDSVARNYRFVQDPANATAFHMGPYVPDYEYYKAMTQVSKMTPDEYAYENASLDRRSNFGRDSEAEIAYTPPSINTIKDGVDISKTDIRITDETVFSLVNEVFGA